MTITDAQAKRAAEMTAANTPAKDLKDPAAQAQLAALGADLMVVVAYGLILPRAVRDAPSHRLAHR